jgi:hypothetical protein
LDEQPVAAELHQAPCLSDAELAKLAALGREVERFYRFPQDIEWAIQDGELMLLQARPVTSEVRPHEGLLYIWDNSNIVESYGGITLPLTFTFAWHVYHQVYVQFYEVLGVPQREIRNMDPFLRNMLASFYGRVYHMSVVHGFGDIAHQLYGLRRRQRSFFRHVGQAALFDKAPGIIVLTLMLADPENWDDPNMIEFSGCFRVHVETSLRTFVIAEIMRLYVDFGALERTSRCPHWLFADV